MGLILLSQYGFAQLPFFRENNIKDDSKNLFVITTEEVDGSAKILSFLENRPREIDIPSDSLSKLFGDKDLNYKVLEKVDGISFLSIPAPKSGSQEILNLLKRESVKAIPFYKEYLKNRKKKQIEKLKNLNEQKSKLEKEETITNLRKLKEEISKEKQKLDDYTKLIKRINDETKQVVFPTFNKVNRERIFGLLYTGNDRNSNFSFGNSASLQINNSGTIVETNLISSDLGPFRVSFGTLLTNATEDENDDENQSDDGLTPNTTEEDNITQTEAFQRLLSGGGNTFLNFELPVLFASGEFSSIYLNTSARVGLDIEEFGDDIETTSGNGNVNSNLYGSVSSKDKVFTFFGQINYGLYFGSKEFYQNLGVTSEKAFGFGRITVGFTINNFVRFGLTLNTLSSESNLRSGTIVVGSQVLAGFGNNQ